MTNSTNTMMVAIIALVIGLAVGFGGASLAKKAMPDSGAMMAANQPMASGNMMGGATDSKASDLRNTLSSALTAHVDLASMAMRKGYDGSADFDASAKALDDNSVAISQAIGSVYGDEAGATFLKNWRAHIGFFVDYTTALKKGDKAGQDKAISDLRGYSATSAAFLSQANPNLPESVLEQTFNMHIDQLVAMINAYAAKDYTTSYAKQMEAFDHMNKTAGVLAGAIVKQYPDKF